MARNKKKAGAFKANFDDVEVRAKVPDGDYKLSVSEIEPFPGEGKEPGYWRWKFKVKDEDEKLDGAIVSCVTSFKPQALFNLRNLLEALGAEIPDGETELDPDDYIDMELIGTVERDNGYSNVVDYMPVDDGDEKVTVKGGKDKSDKKADKGKAGKGKKKEVEKVKPETVEEADEDELEELIKEHDLDDVDLDDHKKLKAKRQAVLDALKEKDLLEEDDAGGDKIDPATIRDADEDELEEIVKKHKLKVDLDDFKTLKKKVNAVLDAAEKAEVLAEEE